MPHHEVPAINRRNARHMRKSMTDAELRLWNEVRAHRLMGLSFRRQLPVAGYIVDFACSEHKLIIEIDGAQHNEDSALKYDADRTAMIAELGWIVLRFSNDDVFKRIDAVCDAIIRTIGVDKFS